MEAFSILENTNLFSHFHFMKTVSENITKRVYSQFYLRRILPNELQRNDWKKKILNERGVSNNSAPNSLWTT